MTGPKLDDAAWQDELMGMIHEQIRKVGWFAMGVLPDLEADTPTFLYTIGLFQTQVHPEIIAFGLPPDLAFNIVGNSVALVQDGVTLPDDGTRVDGVMEHEEGGHHYAPVYLPIAPEIACEHLCWAENYSEVMPPAIQLVWPDVENLYPWEDGYDHDRFPQPVIGTVP